MAEKIESPLAIPGHPMWHRVMPSAYIQIRIQMKFSDNCAKIFFNFFLYAKHLRCSQGKKFPKAIVIYSS